jgi:hypothetical protein
MEEVDSSRFSNARAASAVADCNSFSMTLVSETLRRNILVVCFGLGVPSVSAVNVTDFRDVDEVTRCGGRDTEGMSGIMRDWLRRKGLRPGSGGNIFFLAAPAGLRNDFRIVDLKISSVGGTRGMIEELPLVDVDDTLEALRIMDARLAVPDNARPDLCARHSVKC